MESRPTCSRGHLLNRRSTEPRKHIFHPRRGGGSRIVRSTRRENCYHFITAQPSSFRDQRPDRPPSILYYPPFTTNPNHHKQLPATVTKILVMAFIYPTTAPLYTVSIQNLTNYPILESNDLLRYFPIRILILIVA